MVVITNVVNLFELYSLRMGKCLFLTNCIFTRVSHNRTVSNR